jgi:predicted ATPase/DNA-binding NarL/FixJ family response regulator
MDRPGLHQAGQAVSPLAAEQVPLLASATTPYIGRVEEQATLQGLLSDPACRLVTVTGIGGVGKTRLAAEVVAMLRSSATGAALFPDGVVWVSLAMLAPSQALAEQLAVTIATALGLPIAGPDAALVQVGHFLHAKALLLVLDNVEHVLGGVTVFSQLLHAAPRLTLLLTSREPLRLRGERVIPLHGLPYPDDAASASAESAAVRFFLALMQVHAPDLPAAAHDLPAIARICQTLGGLPLGIELAASWTRVLSCAEIADELTRSFDFLGGSLSDLPERQASLRAVFLSSWRLLTDDEQRAARQLAVLPASFTREAATQIAGVSLPLLASLTNKSLVRRSPADGATRFVLPEPLRPYLAEALRAAGEQLAAAERHSAYYLRLLAARTPDLRGPQQPLALRELSHEIGHIRVAWQHALGQRALDQLDRAMAGLFHLYDMRSWFGEGASIFGAARGELAAEAQTDAATRRIWARLLAREAWFEFQCGRQVAAKAQLVTSLQALRACDAPPAEIMWALNYLAAVCSYLGEYDATLEYCNASLALADAEERLHERVVALSVLCQSAYDQGDLAAARRWGEASLALEQRIGSPWSMAFSLLNLGKVVAAQGDALQAQSLFTRSLQIRRELGDLRGTAICLNRLGDTALALHDLPGAVQHYSAALEQFRAIGNPWGIAAALLQLGRFATRYSTPAVAARLLHEALELALNTGSVPQGEAVMAAFDELMQAGNQTQRDVASGTLPTQAAHDPVPYHVAAARLLAWSAGAAPAALTLAEALDATRAAATQPQATTASPSAAASSAGLTARELDVLRRVAQGLTDAQVAEQLVLSPRTVQSHLASIYGKLGVNSRSAATRYALEHGLV